MCGICGYYSYRRESSNDLPSLIKEMTDTLKHRGPDEEGYFCSNNIALGHRRLCIIDLKSGKQPIYNEDKTKIIIFNGEIYNYKEIRQHLMSKGHSFSTNSDTETILHLYEDIGKKCVNKLRGMFSFVIYDKKKHSLFAARDRLGIKPFYYSFENGEFLFGSEIKAILASKKISKEIDLESLSDYLTYLYIPAPKSIFSRIKKLPAGYTLSIENETLTVSKYWDIDFSRTKKHTEDEWIDILNNIIDKAVELRMISEVPLGGFLSGGVDSSCIIGIMSRFSNTPIITNSIGFKEAAFNELEYARQTSQYFGTDHREYTVSMNCSDILDKLAWYFDEPFADSSALPTYYVSKMTRENVTVALSGDGGDENFAGYRRYYYDRLENNLRRIIPGFLRKSLIQLFSQIYPKADWLPQIFRAKTLLTNLSIDAAEGYFNTMSHFNKPMKQAVLHPEITDKLAEYNSFNVFMNHYRAADTDDLLSKIQYVDIKSYLVDDILTKVDRASMANSLEVRVPLLDHVFMECVATIPSTLKLRGKNGKYLFKKLVQHFLPAQFLNRKKMGFSIPLDIWFRNELKLVVNTEIFADQSYCKQFFNTEKLKSMWYEHQRGTRNYGTQFWTILMLEKWAKKFL